MQYLIEPGASRSFGAYARGHVDKCEFIETIDDEIGRRISIHTIHHCWGRRLPHGEVQWLNRPGRGAFPVTLAEW